MASRMAAKTFVGPGSMSSAGSAVRKIMAARLHGMILREHGVGGKIFITPSDAARQYRVMPKRGKTSSLSPIADWYFRPRRCENRLYERLGIRGFKRLMFRLVGEATAARMGWFALSDRSGNLDEALRSTRRKSRQNEAVHALVLMALAVIAIHLLAEGRAPEAVALLIVNIPFNLYPLMLQRHTRERLNRLLADRRG